MILAIKGYKNAETHLHHGRLIGAALSTVSLVSLLTFGTFIVLLDKPFSTPDTPISLSLSKVHAMGLPESLHQSLHSPHTGNQFATTSQGDSYGIVMSCPVERTKIHDGPWKPQNLARGAEAVVRQLIALNVTIPFYFAYYQHEQSAALPFCRSLAADVADALAVHCFPVPDPFPAGQYGYAKIFALIHVPVRHALWFDCDAFPIRDPSPLFVDPEYRKAGAMYVLHFGFWPDSRDFFDESAILPLLASNNVQEMFPIHAWWVRQGFDTALVLIDRIKSAATLDTVGKFARIPKYQPIRDLSMGDKDLFHIVWMMHGQNYSLVPFVGETGEIKRASLTITHPQRSHPLRGVGSRPRWYMSSQVKYGHDGSAYALHQLHRRLETNSIPVPKRSTYVPPLMEARLDLRTVTDPADSLHLRMHGEFVDRVEKVLIHFDGRTFPDFARVAEHAHNLGLKLSAGTGRFGRFAKVMDQAWRKRANPEAVAQDIVLRHLTRRVGDLRGGQNGQVTHRA